MPDRTNYPDPSEDARVYLVIAVYPDHVPVLFEITFDPKRATQAAKNIKGLVVSVPIWEDHRG